MTQTKPRFASFEEYLSWSNKDENYMEGRFELIDGELVELPPESEPNDFIANFLFLKLVEAAIPPRLVRPGKCEIQVPVLQKGDTANRFPDLVILNEEHLSLTQRRLTIKLDMPPPRLVAEVVSPGKTNRERDFDRKRAQYAKRGIPEYWLIEPSHHTVTVLALESDQYVEVGVFQESDRIISPTFPELYLTAEQVFTAAD